MFNLIYDDYIFTLVIGGIFQLIRRHAPIHKTKLQFCIEEDRYLRLVEEGEKTLVQQQKQLHRQENVKDVLKKHRVC